MFRVAVFLFTLIIAACSLRPVRIVGGTSTTISSHPYLVSIIYNNEHVCGGSLISSRWILTAAHCIDGLTTSLLKVRVGSTHRSSGGTLITSISSIIIHEYYDEDSYDYDVGLIQLTSTLALTTTVATVSLPSSSYTIDIGTQCTVAGWGKTSYGGTLSETLLYLTVPIVSQTSCSATYIYRNTVTDQMICAGYTTGTMDTCQGDSGGPLVYNGIQVGIVSWGAECATVGYPGVYTRVSAIREWITKRAGI
ncbi:trypsin-1-like [Diprion similis]|uniref:trypsin-1-like n=1 Tax=Diprion similis TaxID=362088 RepID=UPI001EF8E982|nr:trypsin-1-like [Diprion similis]